MPINPRIAINHPAGSVIEINEYNSKNEKANAEGGGGNIQIKSVGNTHIVSDEQLNLISNGSNVFLAKDSIHVQAAKLTNWAEQEITIENQLIVDQTKPKEAEMGNRIRMSGCITTIESRDKAKVHIQGGPGMDPILDASQITATLNEHMKISMNMSGVGDTAKIEIIYNDFNKMVFSVDGILIEGLLPVSVKSPSVTIGGDTPFGPNIVNINGQVFINEEYQVGT